MTHDTGSKCKGKTELYDIHDNHLNRELDDWSSPRKGSW